MAKLTSAAWLVHELGLATAIGGTLFGRQALQPALRELGSDRQRAQVSDAAWRRFGWINLAAHGAIAATWFAGRAILRGSEVSRTSRRLTVIKDGLIVASLVTGVASVILGRVLGKRMRDYERGAPLHDERTIHAMRKSVGVLGIANLLTNVSIAAVTTGLSMEASRSLPFSFISRRLP